MTRYEEIVAYRQQGMTYKEIATKIGVTKQRVAQIIGKQSIPHFRPIIHEDCIFPNLMKWMNENKVSRKEFCRRMNGGDACDASYFTKIMRGEKDIQKSTIDKMLKVTGLTYEVMFYEEKECVGGES